MLLKPKIIPVSVISPGATVFNIKAVRDLQKYPTTESFIEKMFPGKGYDFLGTGSFGDAFLLDDGSVMKITASIAEAYCVQLLFQLQEKSPDVYSKYFPKIYGVGVVDDHYISVDDTDVDAIKRSDDVALMIMAKEFAEGGKDSREYLGDDVQGYMFPVFWYIREDLDDIIDEDGGEGGWEEFVILEYGVDIHQVVNDKIDEVKREFGIILLDAETIDNWGIRKKTGEIIFRDLVCTDSNYDFDDVLQL